MLLLEIPRWVANWLIPICWVTHPQGFFHPFMRTPACTWDVLMFICGGHHYEIMAWPHEISGHQRRLGPLNATFYHYCRRGEALFHHSLLIGVYGWQWCLAHFVEDR